MSDQAEARPMIEHDGRLWPFASAICFACGNFWWYVDIPEFQPCLCCYCGMKFRYYVDHEGIRRNQNGLPI